MEEGIDLPDYAVSVLNINEQIDGSIRGIWQFDRKIFSNMEVDHLVRAYKRFLQRLDAPPGTAADTPVFDGSPPPPGLTFSSNDLFGKN